MAHPFFITAAVSRPVIRAATAADREPFCRVLVGQFPGTSMAFWRAMFAYGWLPEDEKPDYGVVLELDGVVRGFFGAMYSTRVVDGRAERFCNVCTWGVEPEVRQYSLGMARALTRRPGYTYTNLTCRADLVPLFKSLGFVLADEHKLVSLARPATPLAARRSPVRVLGDAERQAAPLSDAARAVLDDHLGRTFDVAVLEARGACCLVLSKRAYHPGVRFPCTELFYVSDPAFLAQHFEASKFRLMLRYRTAGVSADRRIFGFNVPGARRVPATALVKSAAVTPERTDALYSELAYLP